MFSKVNWGAIIAGGFIAVASSIFFSLFALATGINGINVVQTMVPEISVVAAIYTVVATSASLALGGYCTVRLAGIRNPGAACLHALSSFSVVAALVPYFTSVRSFAPGMRPYVVGGSEGMYVSVGIAWTLFFLVGIGSMAAAAGGVWGSKAAGAFDSRSSEIETDKREQRWPAA